MRSPSLFVVLALVGLAAAACSHPKPSADKQLDLMLPDGGAPPRVASALEIWGKARTAPVAPARTGLDAPHRARTRAPARHHAPRLTHVPLAARTHQPPHVAGVPAPTPPTQPAAAPAPQPGPQPTVSQPDHGLGGLGGAILRGIGGVIILRGGQSGIDPCDERGHGMGGALPIPRRGGRFPGGIIF